MIFYKSEYKQVANLLRLNKDLKIKSSFLVLKDVLKSIW